MHVYSFPSRPWIQSVHSSSLTSVFSFLKFKWKKTKLGGCFNIKTHSYQFRNSCDKDRYNNYLMLLTGIPKHEKTVFIWSHWNRALGADSIQRYHLTSIGNPIVEIRRSYDHLISTMGFPILVRWHLYIESGPWCPQISTPSPEKSAPQMARNSVAFRATLGTTNLICLRVRY